MMNTLFEQTLISETPKGISGEKLKMYAPLIGSWDFEWVGYQNADQIMGRYFGEWYFSWVLDGKAIQDNWICPSRQFKNQGNCPEGQYGTTLRFYDPLDDRVKIFWLGVENPQHTLFYSESVNNTIIQREIYSSGSLDKNRVWLFEDITEDSFVWKCHESVDGHQRLTQQLFAKRIKS